MAEQLPDGIMKPGHRIDPGPFTLDLYRLVCIVLADKQLAEHSHLRLLQGYRDIEVIRVLISIAATVRILLDQYDGPREYRLDPENCGLLWPNWTKRKKKSKVLTLRDACNKIIHADDVRFDLVIPDAKHNPDEEGAYIRPYVYLYGKQGSNAWRAKLLIMDFIESSATAFCRQEGSTLYTRRHR